jgi:RNA 3'-terminal phosphate cyclase (ATP)
MIILDGSFGEGGGQIVRSSLALSMVTGKPVTIENLRARRAKPGLQRQHLTAVKAAQEVCGASVAGAELHSTRLTFQPHAVRPGEYRFDIGSAGSTTLVLQTVLPALMLAEAPSQLRLIGGTHNPLAPPHDFLAKVYAPLLERVGPKLTLDLVRYGFYPAGGGELSVHVQPAAQLNSLELLTRGQLLRQEVRAIVSKLPLNIAQREVSTIRAKTGWKEKCFHVEEVDSPGPGNVVLVELKFEHVSELFVAFGEKGVPAERVAQSVARELNDYLAHDAPIGPHLADQLLLPLGLSAQQGRGGRFRTGELTEHTRTHIEVLKRFLEIEIDVQQEQGGTHLINVAPPAAK